MADLSLDAVKVGDELVVLYDRGQLPERVTVTKVTATRLTTSADRGNSRPYEQEWTKATGHTYPRQRSVFTVGPRLMLPTEPRAAAALAAQARRQLAAEVNAAMALYADTNDPTHLTAARNLLAEHPTPREDTTP